MENFILEIPKWKGEIKFSSEWMNLLLVIAVLTAGIFLCFWGYRYFQTISLVLLGCLCGMIGYKIGSFMTSNRILQMWFFVMFTFLGVCMCYFLSTLWVYFINKLGIQSFLQKTLHIIASVMGAVIVGITTYMKVYHNFATAAVIILLLMAAGGWYGMRNVRVRRVFRTYDDLIKMKPLTEEEWND